MVKMDIVVSLFSNIKAVNYPSHVSLMELLGKIGDCDRSIKRLVDVVSKEKDKSKRRNRNFYQCSARMELLKSETMML